MKEKFWGVVEGAMNFFTVGLFVVVFAAILLQVFMRFVINSPLVWSEELSRYSFIWLSMLGWVYATKNGSHIKINAFVDALPSGTSRALKIFNNIAVIAFSLALSWYGAQKMMMSFDMSAVTLKFINFGIIYAVLPLANILIILYIVGGRAK